MNVQEMIDLLQWVEDKTKPVFIFDTDLGEICEIQGIDITLDDRVDINVNLA